MNKYLAISIAIVLLSLSGAEAFRFRHQSLPGLLTSAPVIDGLNNLTTAVHPAIPNITLGSDDAPPASQEELGASSESLPPTPEPVFNETQPTFTNDTDIPSFNNDTAPPAPPALNETGPVGNNTDSWAPDNSTMPEAPQNGTESGPHPEPESQVEPESSDEDETEPEENKKHGKGHKHGHKKRGGKKHEKKQEKGKGRHGKDRKPRYHKAHKCPPSLSHENTTAEEHLANADVNGDGKVHGEELKDYLQVELCQAHNEFREMVKRAHRANPAAVFKVLVDEVWKSRFEEVLEQIFHRHAHYDEDGKAHLNEDNVKDFEKDVNDHINDFFGEAQRRVDEIELANNEHNHENGLDNIDNLNKVDSHDQAGDHSGHAIPAPTPAVEGPQPTYENDGADSDSLPSFPSSQIPLEASA